MTMTTRMYATSLIGKNPDNTAKVPVMGNILPEDRTRWNGRYDPVLDGAIVPACCKRLLDDMPLAVIVGREISHPFHGRGVDLSDEETEQDERVREEWAVFLPGVRVEIYPGYTVTDLIG